MGWPSRSGGTYVTWDEFQALLDALNDIITISSSGSGTTVTLSSGAVDYSTTPSAVTLTPSIGTSPYASPSDHRHAIDVTIAPTWSATHTFGANIMPNVGYVGNIGSLSTKFLALYAGELWVENLVAQNTIATIGGRILVGPTTELTVDLGSAVGDTTITTKHNNLAVNDNVYCEANGAVEFMLVTAGPSGTGPYTYTVTRDRDGTGRNAWAAGSAVFNTGTTGDGFIDIYSVSGMIDASSAGPTIVGNVRTGTDYNAWSEHWAIGNLKNTYGYAADTYGAAFGEYSNDRSFITIDATNGIRMQARASGVDYVWGQWHTNGGLTIGRVGASLSNVYIASGAIQLRNNTTVRIQLSADGSGYLANSNISWDVSGNLTVNAATIGAWTVASTYLYTTTAGMATADYPFYAGDTYANRASAEFRVTTAGALVASSATITGAITATSGSVGSFTIGTYLYTGSKTAYNDTNAGVHLGSDGLGIGNNVFTVSSAGALVATSATITGTVNATAGYFGDGSTRVAIEAAGINVGNTGSIRGGQTAYDTGTGFWLGYSSAYKLSIGNAAGNKLTWDGSTLSITGTVTASAGAIGGWTIGAASLSATNIALTSGAANTANITVGSGSDAAGINSPAAGTDIAFWAGDTFANRATSEFRVTAAGALTATNATLTGYLTVTGAPGISITGSASGWNAINWTGLVTGTIALDGYGDGSTYVSGSMLTQATAGAAYNWTEVWGNFGYNRTGFMSYCTQTYGDSYARMYTNIAGSGTARNLYLKSTGAELDCKLDISGLLTTTGGVHVGSTSDPGTDNLIVDGTSTLTGTAYIGDTANANVTLGLTINQGAADDHILALKSSDVAHGMTTYAETDSYGTFQKALNASGGLNIKGISASNIGMLLAGFCATAPSTTKATNATAAIEFQALLKDGTSGTNVGTDGNLMCIINNATTRFIFDAEGEAHADVAWSSFETEDDLALLEALETELLRSRKSERAAGLSKHAEAKANRKALQDRGLVHWPGDDARNADGSDATGMLNLTRLPMLHTGAIRQLDQRLLAVERRLAI